MHGSVHNPVAILSVIYLVSDPARSSPLPSKHFAEIGALVIDLSQLEGKGMTGDCWTISRMKV